MELVYIFVNIINIYEGGIYEEGFCSVLMLVVNKYVKDCKLLKDKDFNFIGDDIWEGLVVVILVKVSEL